MKIVTFVVPVHGRLELAAVCLRQLRRMCDLMRDDGVEGRAVVVGAEDDLRILDPAALEFATAVRNNVLGARYNDGIQLATDPAFNPSPSDYVVPFGSDDWADHRLFLEPLPPPTEIHGFQRLSFVSEDGQRIAATHVHYLGGCGIRIIPRELLATLVEPYRPCAHDRPRGCDTSILVNLRRHHGQRLTIKHLHLHDRQIVDWKSAGAQLNSYAEVTAGRKPEVAGDPFEELEAFYPSESLEEMRELYAARL